MNRYFHASLPIALLLLLSCFLLTGIAAARDGTERLTQRTQFKAAEKALKQGDQRRYRRIKAKLKGYPLYPYLEYQEILGDLDRARASQVQNFLDRYRGTLLASRLRSAWLAHLAKSARWQTYLKFDRPGGSTTRRCNRLQALIHSGQAKVAFSQVAPLWLSGRSQPKACDPVFRAWREAGYLTPERVWARIELAMDRGQTHLARYLGRFLEDQEQTWLDLYLQVHRNPKHGLNSSILAENHPHLDSILLHSIKRLARKEPLLAISRWEELARQRSFTLRQRYDVERALALGLIRNDDQDAIEYLRGLEPRDDDLQLHQARIRAALARRDWPTALLWLQALPEQEEKRTGWQYWTARALAELGHKQEAESLYRQIAAERGYYGFLAADRLGLSYNLGNTPLQVSEQELERFLRRPAVQRVYELRALERLNWARREWEWVLGSLSKRELQVGAKLAQTWRWHDRAIFTLARTRYWEDLELRFPLEYQDRVDTEARHRKLDHAWVFAVVRQESAFSTDARSHAGAMGLMQLMPKTAHRVARKLGKRFTKDTDLLKPGINIRFGTAYLRQVMDTFDQHPVLATAAYNAGPHRVRSWFPQDSMPADLWIETLPFKETRGYLRRVLAYTVIYEHRLGLEPTPLRKRMRPINGKALAGAPTGKKSNAG